MPKRKTDPETVTEERWGFIGFLSGGVCLVPLSETREGFEWRTGRTCFPVTLTYRRPNAEA